MMKEMSVPHLDFPRIEATLDFIERNKFRLMSVEDIVGEIKVADDSFGFYTEVLLNTLSYEDGMQFWSEDYKRIIDDKEGEHVFSSSIEDITQDFLDYMVFAWGKAIDERGLSAGRSVRKLAAWMWLLNRKDLGVELLDETNFAPYGAPILISVSEKLGLDVPQELKDFAQIK